MLQVFNLPFELSVSILHFGGQLFEEGQSFLFCFIY